MPTVASPETLCVSLRRLRFTGFAARIKFPHPLLLLQTAVAVYFPQLAVVRRRYYKLFVVFRCAGCYIARKHRSRPVAFRSNTRGGFLGKIAAPVRNLPKRLF